MHPNIVQYLGSYQNPETQLPVLLLELMDESLTQFLERSQEPLPCHIQVNICHDITMALAYLHSNDIIHRDLSSNNVLLIGAGNRAKVTDFGMAKLFDVNTTMTKTMCPGTPAYMSPEAFDDPAGYTEKLDTFSFGVLNIQIITRQLPNPGPRMKKVQDPRDPKRRLQEVVLETERRKSHIDLIEPTHPLLPIASVCLSYNEEGRPSAQDLCNHLAALKEVPQYVKSVQQAQDRSRPTQSATANREDRERQIRELQREKEECDKQILILQRQLQASDGRIGEKDKQLISKESHHYEARESHLHGLSQVAVPSLQQDILKKENQHLLQELGKVSLQARKTQKGKATLNWSECKAAPFTMCRGSAIEFGRIAYLKPDGSSEVHSYNSDTEEWSTLPKCLRDNFTLTVINDLVTAVGGRQSVWFGDGFTNTLLSFTAIANGKWEWVMHFPPMPTKREFTAVVCSGKALVVAGGKGEKNIKLATVEIMDTSTLQWSTARSLPTPLHDGTAIACGDRLYLVGTCNEDGYSIKSVFTCSLGSLLQSHDGVSMKSLFSNRPVIWHMIADLPATHSTCVILNGQLLAVGGYDSHTKDTNNIYSYNTNTDSWKIISHMPTLRHKCLVTVLPGNKLMVVGGQVERNVSNAISTVEIATVDHKI